MKSTTRPFLNYASLILACLVSGFGKRAKIRTVCTGPKLRSAATVRAAANQWSERLRTTGDRRPSRSRRRLAVPPRTRRSRPRCRPSTRRLRVRPPPEPTGPRHCVRRRPSRWKTRTCAFTRSNSPLHLDFLDAFASPMQVAKKSNSGFSTVRLSSTGRLWILDNVSLEVMTSTRSRMRSSGRDGRFACGARARRLATPWLDLGRQRQALLNESSHRGCSSTEYCRRRNEHGKRSDPHLLSSGRPERGVRCAIAQF